MNETVDRVVVFMDYQNVHGWARRQFFRSAPPRAADTSSRSRSPSYSPNVGSATANFSKYVFIGADPTRNASQVRRVPTTDKPPCGSAPIKSP